MIVRTFIGALVVLAAQQAIAQDQPLVNPAAAFGARESVSDISLSPDGGEIVYLAPGQGQSTNAFAVDLASGESQIVAASPGDPSLRWCEYSGSDRLACFLHGLVADGETIFSYTRMIAFDSDGENMIELGQRRSWYDAYARQHSGFVIDWLPGEDGDVLMSRVYVPEAGRAGTRFGRREEGLGVDRIDTRTGRTQRIETPQAEIGVYYTDGRGTPRMIGSREVRGATGMAGTAITYHYRRPGQSEWLDFGSYDMNTEAGFYPVVVDAELDAVYGLQELNGRDALYRVKLDGSMARELVFAHDRVDVDNVVRLGRAGRVIGVSFAEDQRTTQYFDDEYRALAQSLSRAIPGLPLIRFAAASDDEKKLLIWAGSDSDPGRYFTYDKTARSLNEITLARPQLEHARLASVRAISYPAGDGTAIPGYLTLPPGREDARGLPAIVMPHGGPSARDEWGFDWLAQYFAYQGYAVLQPNFRGSAGYGDEWFVENGFRSWEIAIGDIIAGGRWLVSEGTADPDKLAIVGWSYGGYAALQSGVVAPELFKAIVAIAPVADLGLLRDMARIWTSGANVREFVGEGPHIRAGSPAQNAERIVAPVLMFHGDRDANVPIRQARYMRDQLRGAGREVELVEFADLDHQIDDSAARARMLERSDAFLREAFGMPALAARPGAPEDQRAEDPAESTGPMFPGLRTPEGAVGVEDDEPGGGMEDDRR